MKLILLSILLILCLIYCYYNLESFTGEISSPLENIKKFTKEISIYRPIGSDNLNIVKNKIINKMNSLGLTTTKQSFKRIINNKEYSFDNLIGVNPKVKNNFILIGAHIDSPQIEGCESAIDAATSISVILELADKILKQYPLFPLMIVFVDGEEAIDGAWANHNTLSGSSYFVDNYDLSLIERVYIFDLIGGNPDYSKISAFRNNPDSFDDINKLALINSEYKYNIFNDTKTYISDSSIIDDHVPFINKGIPSLNLIPYNFPSSHHTLEDNYENINWDYVETFYNVFLKFLINNLKDK